MISDLFHTFVYNPLYNGLVFFVDIAPSHDVGIAVIALTIVVRFFLYPLSKQAIRTQIAMREVAPEIEAIKERLKDKREEQARAIFALYRERNIRPFASFLLMLVQLPILIGLYWVFWQGGLPQVNADLLYSFVPNPPTVNMRFLGLMDMAERSVVLAVLAGLTQLAYARLSMGPRKPSSTGGEPSFSGDMARSFDLQARYVFPIIIAGVSYTVTAAVPLYLVASNLFMIGQEYISGRRFAAEKTSKSVEATKNA